MTPQADAAPSSTAIAKTVDELASMVAETPTRIFVFSFRRTDAETLQRDDEDPQLDLGTQIVDDGQEFTVGVRVANDPAFIAVRTIVETATPDGVMELELGAQFVWDSPVSYADGLVERFASEVAIPHTVAIARVHIEQGAKIIGIDTAMIPFTFHRTGRWSRK